MSFILNVLCHMVQWNRHWNFIVRMCLLYCFDVWLLLLLNLIVFAPFLIIIIKSPKQSMEDLLFLLRFLLLFLFLLLRRPECSRVTYCYSTFLFHYYYITLSVVGWCIAILHFFFTIIITSPRTQSGDVLLFYVSFYYYYSSTHFCPLHFSEMPWSNFMKPCRNIICHVKLCW